MNQTTQTNLFLAEVLFFEGTYGSLYDLNEVEPDEDMSGQDVEVFWKKFDFSSWLTELGKEYINCLDCEIHDLIKLKLEADVPVTRKLLKFESTTSPKEYNFSSDRLFCYIDGSLLDLCVKHALNHEEEFARYLGNKFTSRSGFIGLYSNRTRYWFDKLAKELDYIEVGAYLEFFLLEHLGNIKDSVYDYIRGNSDLLSIS